MRVFVTGATGYIGKEVVKYLNNKGHKVIMFSKSLGYDITNTSHIKKTIKNSDVVIHLAALKKYSGDYKKIKNINVNGTYNILKVAEEEGIERVIYISSVAVTEKTETLYSKSKKEAEKIAFDFQKNIKIPILRIAPVYDENRLKLIKKFKILPIIKDLNLHLVYLKKVVEAIYLSIFHGNSEIYYVADKNSFLFQNLANTLKDKYKIIYFTKKDIELIKKIFALIKNLSNFINIEPPITQETISAFFEDRNYNIQKTIKDLKYEPVDTIEIFKKILL
ncbi:MAG: NAD(P)-dependent oxidoreductase [Candidatus Aenigmatarchaeota archaeon]|nr:NAD(P)-dependent oxidoreductase [Candidatus Aenigmarchaeota archaeon]